MATKKKTKSLSGASVSKKELERIKKGTPRRTKFPPRAKGSGKSFAFTSLDKKGRKTTRFSNLPKIRKGEKRKRFE